MTPGLRDLLCWWTLDNMEDIEMRAQLAGEERRRRGVLLDGRPIKVDADPT